MQTQTDYDNQIDYQELPSDEKSYLILPSL